MSCTGTVGVGRIVAAVLTAAGVAACGGPRAVVPVSLELPTFALTDASADDLAGTWAQLQVTTSESSGGIAGSIVSTNRRLLLLEATEADDGTLTMSGTLCSMTVDTESAVASTVVPDAFVATFPPVVLTGRVARERRAVSVSFDRAWETVGAADAGPEGALPAGADDPLVLDTDQDGQPGVTISVTGIGGGDMYFAQRTGRSFEVVEANGVFLDGVVTWTSERVVLDATSRLLRNARESVPTNDAERNWFRSTRVADGTTCEDLVGAGDALFVRAEATAEPDGSGSTAEPDAPDSEPEALPEPEPTGP